MQGDGIRQSNPAEINVGNVARSHEKPLQVMLPGALGSEARYGWTFRACDKEPFFSVRCRTCCGWRPQANARSRPVGLHSYILA